MLRVYVWRGLVDDGTAADLACAAEDGAGLRTACRAVGVSLPSRPDRARATDDVVQIAMAHPGQVLCRGGRDPHWRLLPHSTQEN